MLINNPMIRILRPPHTVEKAIASPPRRHVAARRLFFPEFFLFRLQTLATGDSSGFHALGRHELERNPATAGRFQNNDLSIKAVVTRQVFKLFGEARRLVQHQNEEF